MQSRVSDLQRQENIEPRSLIRVCSYPVETITNTATVSRSSSANSNLNSSCSWNSLHSATSEELPELPGSVPPRAGGLGATVTETNSIRYSIRTTTANDENSANDVENRQREIDRRNSMYPSQLRSCYPMENFDTVASGVSLRSLDHNVSNSLNGRNVTYLQPATRSNLGSRKRPMPKSQVSVNALFEDAPNQPKTPNAKKVRSIWPLSSSSKQTNKIVAPLTSSPLSSSFLSSAKRSKKVLPFPLILIHFCLSIIVQCSFLNMPLASLNSFDEVFKGSESTPQKFLQRVTKGRRSKVEPLVSSVIAKVCPLFV